MSKKLVQYHEFMKRREERAEQGVLMETKETTRELYKGTEICTDCQRVPYFEPKQCTCHLLVCAACRCLTCDSCRVCCMCKNFTPVSKAYSSSDYTILIEDAGLDDDAEVPYELVQLYCTTCEVVKPHMAGYGGYVWCQECCTLFDHTELSQSYTLYDGLDKQWFNNYVGRLETAAEDVITEGRALWLDCAHCSKLTEFKRQWNGAFRCENCRTAHSTLSAPASGGGERMTQGGQTYYTSYGNQTTRYTRDGHEDNELYGGWGGYTGYGVRGCNHWRDVFAIGDGYVTLSAWFDRDTAHAKREDLLTPDYGVYLAESWKPAVVTTHGFNELEGIDYPYPAVFYEWEDMAAPKYDGIASIFKWMVTKLRNGSVIDIGCLGAHGRTGTLLAMLLMEIEELQPAEAIKRVRRDHCERGIETWKQEDYIYQCAGQEPPKRTTPTPKTASSYSVLPRKTQGAINKTQGAINQHKYSNRQERNKAKKERRANRTEWASWLKTYQESYADALIADPTLRWNQWVLDNVETQGYYLQCETCHLVNLRTCVTPPSKRQIIRMDARESSWCAACREWKDMCRPIGIWLTTSEETAFREKMERQVAVG